jgi:hypothetical protein
MIFFTDNYQDRSTNDGYQFEFYCRRCGNGYTSSFQHSVTGFGGRMLRLGGDPGPVPVLRAGERRREVLPGLRSPAGRRGDGQEVLWQLRHPADRRPVLRRVRHPGRLIRRP